ncbi:MAG TPA: hypothetical protein DEG69_02505 [Flavobacteriaceae bacterium]|nr:hypothetical protein [Flavobacteriaceae bacterium]
MQENLIRKHTINELIEIMGDNPQNDDLHVHISKNKYEEIPITYPFRTDDYSLIFVVKGEIKIQLNLREITIKSGEIIPVKPKVAVQLLKISKNLEIIGICFSVDFILKNSFTKIEFDKIEFFTRENVVKLKLSPTESKTTVSLSKLLKQYNNPKESGIPFKGELIKHTFGGLIFHCSSVFKKNNPNLELSVSRNEELAFRFLKLLNDNFKAEKSVQFYADVLSITSGHLSKVLKEVSGKTAGQLIVDTVIMEAKILLGNPSLSIAQVADELQFSDQSFFGKYFKKYSGLSPSQFRNLKLQLQT